MKKIIGYFLLIIALFSPLFFLVRPAFAQSVNLQVQTCDPASGAIVTNGKGIITAFGCIETTPAALVQKLFTISLGMAGGIAFLMIILGALQIQTSAGNPERVNQGREIVEGAVTGLLLIIFAIFILKVIGVNILAIPGFQ